MLLRQTIASSSTQVRVTIASRHRTVLDRFRVLRMVVEVAIPVGEVILMPVHLRYAILP